MGVLLVRSQSVSHISSETEPLVILVLELIADVVEFRGVFAWVNINYREALSYRFWMLILLVISRLRSSWLSPTRAVVLEAQVFNTSQGDEGQVLQSNVACLLPTMADHNLRLARSVGTLTRSA